MMTLKKSFLLDVREGGLKLDPMHGPLSHSTTPCFAS